jgi:hypothetical protein
MTSIHRLLGLFMAIALVVFAQSSQGATKTVTLTDATGYPPFVNQTLPAGANQTIYVSVNNTGQSNGSSFEIDFSSVPYLVVNSAQIVGSTVTGQSGFTALSGTGYSSLRFAFTSPTKTSVIVALNVSISNACGANTTINWQAWMWNGGVSNPSNLFTPSPVVQSYVNTATTCALSFVKQPASAFINSIITSEPFNSGGVKVQVQALADNVAVPGLTITATMKTGSPACSIADSNATTGATGIAAFSTLTSTVAADITGCQLTAKATGFVSADSSTFDIFKPDGQLGCASNNNTAAGSTYDPDAAGDFFGAAGFGLKRHTNLTGDCPSVIPYKFFFNFTTNQGYFVADKLGQAVIVEYVLVLNAESTIGGWPNPEPHPSFASAPFANFPPLPGDYIAGVACNNDLVDNTSVPAPAKVCVAQMGWTGVAVGKIQRWIKVIDLDSYVKI